MHSHLTRWQVRPRAGRAAVLAESPTLPMRAPESAPHPAWRGGVAARAGDARARTGCSGSHALPSSAHAFALLVVSWCAASGEFFGLGRSQDAKKRTATPRVFPLCTPPARLTVVLFTLLLLLHVGGVGARGGRRRHGGGDEPPPPPTTPSADPALPLPAAASAYADVADPSPIPMTTCAPRSRTTAAIAIRCVLATGHVRAISLLLSLSVLLTLRHACPPRLRR